MLNQTLRIATRESPLALWQAHFIRSQLKLHWPNLSIEILAMKTSGDRFLNTQLQALGGKGLFVKELEEAILDNRADIAVHSMKDLPAQLPEALSIEAICAREMPWDALVSRQNLTLDALPPNARIGTSSLRRQAQLLHYRPDLRIYPLRGNVGSRLNKLESEQMDAIVLAAAGLRRLNCHSRITQLLPAALMLPACGQGALGIECRREDDFIQSLIAPLHEENTALCVRTERAVNARLNGSCSTPIGVYCELSTPQTLQLHAMISSADGRDLITHQQTGALEDAAMIAAQCADTLFAKGAARLIHPLSPP